MTVDKLQQERSDNNKFVFLRKTLSTASMLGKRKNDISKNLQFT